MPHFECLPVVCVKLEPIYQIERFSPVLVSFLMSSEVFFTIISLYALLIFLRYRRAVKSSWFVRMNELKVYLKQWRKYITAHTITFYNIEYLCLVCIKFARIIILGLGGRQPGKPLWITSISQCDHCPRTFCTLVLPS